MFYALASNSEYMKKRINLFVALAPAVMLHNSKVSNLLNFFVNLEGFFEVKLAELEVYELFGKGWEF